MCLAQGHNSVMPVRLEPAATRSRVKHSTTEPLCSQMCSFTHRETNVVNPDGFLFNCTTVGQVADLMTVLTLSFHPLVGAWCLSLVRHTLRFSLALTICEP